MHVFTKEFIGGGRTGVGVCLIDVMTMESENASFVRIADASVATAELSRFSRLGLTYRRLTRLGGHLDRRWANQDITNIQVE